MNKNKFAIILFAMQAAIMLGASVIASANTVDLPTEFTGVTSHTNQTTGPAIEIEVNRTTPPAIDITISPNPGSKPVITPVPAPVVTPVIPGDADGDGVITENDAKLILKAIVEGKTDVKTMDYNKDGKVTARDAADIFKYLA